MTISAMQVDSLPSSIDEVDIHDPTGLLSSNIDFLERHIGQLTTERDLLQKNAESCITMLELHIRKLSLEKELLLRERFVVSRKPRLALDALTTVGCVPMASLCEFLTAGDIFNLAATSRQVYDCCHPSMGLMVVPHMTTPSEYLSHVESTEMIDNVCLGLISTLFIDAKKGGGKSLMEALAPRSSELRSLRSLRVSAAAETGEFLLNLEKFMDFLPENQIESIHFSGLRSISLVGKLISRQRLSIKHFKVDYFVNGHETDVPFIPTMPQIRSFVFDVADVVHLPVHVISTVLQAVVDKDSVESIYLPHMQIAGQSHEIVEFIELVKQFKRVRQLVIRFRRLPLSVKEIVSLREAFELLPAVCISDHFIVMLDSWATWWPKQSSIWPSADRITGLSVFREQIDFESLGTSANREWLRLSREQKNLWSRRIAANVAQLYLKQSS